MISYTLNAPHMFTSKLSNKKTCGSFGTATTFTRIYSFFHLAVNSIIPYIVVFALNISIMNTIKARTKSLKGENSQIKSSDIHTDDSSNVSENSFSDISTVSGTASKRRGAFSSTQSVMSIGSAMSGDKITRVQNQEKQLAVMLMTVSFAFLILTFPLVLRYFVYTNLDYKRSAATYAMYVFMYNLTNKLYMTNNAINFYLYCMSGTKFRKDVLKLCKCNRL